VSTKHNPLEILLDMPFTDVVSLVLSWAENADVDDLAEEGWTSADDEDWKWVRSGLMAIEERHTDTEG
jgi:hypothetical protein